MNVLVATLEANLLERFQEFAEKLRREHPDVFLNVTSFDGGKGTDNPCHSVSIDCLFRDAPETESDLVALVVLVDHLNARARISADVSWGDPSGYVEDTFRPAPVELSSETLQALYAALPHLYESFESAVVRRKPSV